MSIVIVTVASFITAIFCIFNVDAITNDAGNENDNGNDDGNDIENGNAKGINQSTRQATSVIQIRFPQSSLLDYGTSLIH